MGMIVVRMTVYYFIQNLTLSHTAIPCCMRWSSALSACAPLRYSAGRSSTDVWVCGCAVSPSDCHFHNIESSSQTSQTLNLGLNCLRAVPRLATAAAAVAMLRLKWRKATGIWEHFSQAIQVQHELMLDPL